VRRAVWAGERPGDQAGRKRSRPRARDPRWEEACWMMHGDFLAEDSPASRIGVRAWGVAAVGEDQPVRKRIAWEVGPESDGGSRPRRQRATGGPGAPRDSFLERPGAQESQIVRGRDKTNTKRRPGPLLAHVSRGRGADGRTAGTCGNTLSSSGGSEPLAKRAGRTGRRFVFREHDQAVERDERDIG